MAVLPCTHPKFCMAVVMNERYCNMNYEGINLPIIETT